MIEKKNLWNRKLVIRKARCLMLTKKIETITVQITFKLYLELLILYIKL